MQKKPAQKNKQHLSNLLEVYKRRLKPPQASIEKIVIKAVKEVVGLDLKEEAVTYTVSTKTVHLNVPSILKTELKSKETQIKEYLKKELPPSEVPATFL